MVVQYAGVTAVFIHECHFLSVGWIISLFMLSAVFTSVRMLRSGEAPVTFVYGVQKFMKVRVAAGPPPHYFSKVTGSARLLQMPQIDAGGSPGYVSNFEGERVAHCKDFLK